MVKIRKAKLKEVGEIVEMWKRFMEEHRDMGRKWEEDRIPGMKTNASDLVQSYFSKNIRSKNGLLMVLEDEEQLQGFILCTIQKNIPIFENDLVGYVSSLYIEKTNRNKGYSSRMFKESLDWFSSKGIKEISIKVMCCNPHAHEIYDHWGFRDIHLMMRMDR